MLASYVLYWVPMNAKLKCLSLCAGVLTFLQVPGTATPWVRSYANVWANGYPNIEETSVLPGGSIEIEGIASRAAVTANYVRLQTMVEVFSSPDIDPIYGSVYTEATVNDTFRIAGPGSSVDVLLHMVLNGTWWQTSLEYFDGMTYSVEVFRDTSPLYSTGGFPIETTQAFYIPLTAPVGIDFDLKFTMACMVQGMGNFGFDCALEVDPDNPFMLPAGYTIGAGVPEGGCTAELLGLGIVALGAVSWRR